MMATKSPASEKQQWRKFYILLGVLIVMTGVAYWWGNRTYHFATVQEGVLYRTGNRGIPELANVVAKQHVRTIVSLIDDNELNDPNKSQFQKETAYAARNHINLIRLPVPLGGWPVGDDLKKFIAIVEDPTNRPVLVHCAQGVRRTGMLAAAYQMSSLKWTKEQATNAIITFGHSERSIGDVRKFISDYDPVTKILPTTLPVTGNE